jgi:hypothetical protein
VDRAEREGRMNWVTILTLENNKQMVTLTKFDHTPETDPNFSPDEWSDEFVTEKLNMEAELWKYFPGISYTAKSVPGSKEIDLYFT